MVAESRGGRVQTGQGIGGRCARTSAIVASVVAALVLGACGTPLGASPTTTGPSAKAPTLSLGQPQASDQGYPPITIHAPTWPPASGTRRSSGPDATPDTSRDTSVINGFYRVPSPLNAAPPGSIVRTSVIDSAGLLPAGATAYRVLFHSESITGSDIAESGVIVVPGGAPPATGFPIVSWAHGTTGLAAQCAPSLSGVGTIPYLDQLLSARAIVVATDYQGLGTSDIQPYLVGQSEAQGVLDAARAARNLVGPAASNTVVVIGYSQGGQAALFSGQIAQSYAPELYVAGVASVAPVTSLTELAPPVPEATADGDAGFAVMALYAWSATYGNLPLTSVLTTTALRDGTLTTSACSSAVATAYDRIPTGLIFKPGWSTNPAVSSDDAANEPGQSPISAPVLVVQGTEDALVPYAATTGLVTDTLCHDQHDTVRYVPVAGASHDGALEEGASIIVPWIAGRLAGTAATDTCPDSGTQPSG